MRYIYILVYKDIHGNTTLCKVDIDLNRLIRYGCIESNRHPERRYTIGKQPLTQNGKISVVVEISPSKTHIS